MKVVDRALNLKKKSIRYHKMCHLSRISTTIHTLAPVSQIVEDAQNTYVMLATNYRYVNYSNSCDDDLDDYHFVFVTTIMW